MKIIVFGEGKYLLDLDVEVTTLSVDEAQVRG